MIYDAKMRKSKEWDIPHKGIVGGTTFDYDEKPFHAFHNHGSSGTFSFADIHGFSDNSKMISLTAQGNNGHSKFIVFKTDNYDENGYKTFLFNKSTESFFSIGDKEYTLLSKMDNDVWDRMSKEQREQFIRSRIAKTEECILGGEKYGVKYISSET